MSRVMITGANRGIGLGLVEHYLKSGHCVIAACRNPDSAAALQAMISTGELTIVAMDVGDNQSIEKAAETLTGQAIELLINNAGVGGGQEQSLSSVDVDNWMTVLRINTLSPLFVTRSFLPNLEMAAKPKVMVVSSQLGAISYPNIGLYAYESSKAAVNKVVKGLSQDLKAKSVTVCALHPGWVKTDMGGADAEISVEVAALGLANTIDRLGIEQTGSFWQWNGEEHDW